MPKQYKNIIVCSILIFLFICLNKSYGQTKSIDSIYSLLKSSTNDDDLILNYYNLANAYFNVPDSSLKYINRGLKLSKEKKLIEKEHQGLNLLADYWYYRGVNDSALFVSKKALKIKNSNDTIEKIKTFDTRGKILSSLSQYEEATSSYLNAISLAEKINDPKFITMSSINLGNIYRELGEQDKALGFYNQGLEYGKKSGNKYHIAGCYGNLALVYRAKKQTDKALEAYKKSLKIHRELNAKFNIAIDLQNLGVFYESLEQWKKAKESHLESYQISNEINDNIGVILSAINLGIIENKTNNHKKAIALLDKALVEAKKIDYLEAYKHIYLAYSETYSSMGRYKDAYKNHKKYEKWKDSISSKDYLIKVNELETKYQTEKKENEILQLSQTQLKNEIAIEKKNLWIKRLGYGLLATLLLFSASFIIFKQYSNNKKQKAIITAITETQIAEQKRISQDLHDSVGGSLALTKTKLTSLKSTDPKQDVLDDIINTLSNTADEVRQISHDLMPGELVKFGLIPAVKSLLNNVDSKTLETNLYTHDSEARFDEKIEVHAFRIIQELAQNVLKHAQANTLNVYINKHPKFLSLMVEDNGIGFDIAKNAQKGMGFKTLKNRIDYLNGSLNIDSKKGQGSSFTIQIPLKA